MAVLVINSHVLWQGQIQKISYRGGGGHTFSKEGGVNLCFLGAVGVE